MEDSLTDQTHLRYLIRFGLLAGLTGVIVGREGRRVLLRLDGLAGVHLALPPEAIEVQPA